MHIRFFTLLAVPLCLLSSMANAAANPFVGRWDFTNTTSTGVGANWLGITEKNGALEVWFQPTGGNVSQLKQVTQNGSHLTLGINVASATRPATTWELDAADGKLTGIQKRGDKTEPLTGLPAPALNRKEPKSWNKPEALFNGKDLTGWEPIGPAANSHWVVKDGILTNEEHGANLKTTRTFEDFKLHFEVKCPDDANSGVYLRGRYEIQLEYVPAGSEPPEREMGSIYGRIAPQVKLPRKPGEWESFDVTFVGRTVTITRDGTLIIDHKEIEGITGGALDAKEGEPGPFYIQGDHTGGLQFRSFTVATAKR